MPIRTIFNDIIKMFILIVSKLSEIISKNVSKKSGNFIPLKINSHNSKFAKFQYTHRSERIKFLNDKHLIILIKYGKNCAINVKLDPKEIYQFFLNV